MEILRNLELAARSLSRSRALAALAVLTLGLGIGSTAFMFSIVHGALFRGLPFPDGDRIMRVHGTDRARGSDRNSVQYLDFIEFREEQAGFEELAAGYNGTINVTAGDRAIRLAGAFLTANAFEVLRVRPALGRTLLPGDDAPGASPVIILSDRVWRDEFGADSGVIGRGVRVNGEPGTVVGVMPRGFAFPEVQEAWVAMRRAAVGEERGSGTNVLVFGRLRDGNGLEAAQAELAAIASRLAAAFPETNRDVGVNVIPFTDMGRETTTSLFAMLGAVMLILLVACTNVANLLLARTATRARDIAVRTALGAGRRRLVGQLIAEAAVLAGFGAVLGAGGAWLAMRWFSGAVAYTQPPFWFVFTVDGPILLFTAVVAFTAAVLSGVIPGLKATGGKLHVLLQDDSRGSTSIRIGRLSRALVVGEIALSLGLLVVAGLMARGIIERRNIQLPFPTESVFTARMALFESQYPSAEARQELYDALLRDLRGNPAIAAVSLTSALPGTGSPGTFVAVQGRDHGEDQREWPQVSFAYVSAGFLDTFEAAVGRGRAIEERDTRTAAPVVVINESFAADLFPGEDPVGRMVRLAAAPGDEEPWRMVVGVVPDLAMQGVSLAPGDNPRGLYLPLAQGEDVRFVSIAARPRSGQAMAITAAVRDAVRRLAPDTPLYYVWTLQQGIDRQLWAVDVFGGIMITFGLIALVMAIAGLYGVTAFSVGHRTRELGIRMAMGAARGDVMSLILRQGAMQIGLGIAIGLGLAVGLSFAMRQILFRVQPLDPLVYATITALLTVTALAATAIPALRASRLNPVRALHGD